ncbi:hypothetical protein [Microbacterium elymi]|uniref:hypothetical protein n=1 Tax=Microbacterium elymi TaxID=2909587 RepID=UPI003F496FE4
MTNPAPGASGSPVTSTPVLRAVLIWSAVVTAVLAVIGAVIGFIVAGAPGLFSALAGIILAALFLGITGASILIANRWFGDPLYTPIFFGIVLGGWLLKFVVFIVALIVLAVSRGSRPPSSSSRSWRAWSRPW